jgi:hypothetical protein
MNKPGFRQPYLGNLVWLHSKARYTHNNINKRIGIKKAHSIAKKLGIKKFDCFSKSNYIKFISANNPSSNLVVESAKIITNTIGRPLYNNIDGPTILGSYGLFVNKDGK